MWIEELTQASPVRKPRPRSPWLFRAVLALVLLAIGLLATAYFHRSIGAGSQLQEAMAEAESLSPIWRLSDLEARRTRPGEESNAALWALRAHRLLPADSLIAAQARQVLAEQPPPARLAEAQAEALRAELTRARAALAVTRKLKEFPDGRFPCQFAADFVSTRSACEPARTAAHLLAAELLLFSQAGHTDRALGSVRGILGCARAVGDDPLLASQRIRLDCRAMAVAALQRALAQGVPAAKALCTVQGQLEAENAHALLGVALGGERGGLDLLMAKLQGGEIAPREVSRGGKPLLDGLGGQETEGIREQRATLLRFMNQAVRAAALAPHERVPALRKLDQAAHRLPPVARRVVAPLAPAGAAEQDSLACLRCAVAAVAAERYRLRHGQWPADLAVLQRRGYLAEMPLDPYDGAPLRWRRLDDGLVIYVVGRDGKDNGGCLGSADRSAEGREVGFRLWDAAQRHQPWAPATPGSQAENSPVSSAATGS